MAKPKLLVEIISLSQRASTTLAQLFNEAIGTFTKKAEHFSGQLRNYETEGEDDIQYDSEDTLVVTNTEDKLNYVLKAFTEAVDLNLTKENTNAEAVGTIEVDGNVWKENIPVNAILTAETHVKRLRDLILSVPTLEPKEKWVKTKDNKPALYLTAETHVKRLRDLILSVPTLEPKEKWIKTKDNKPALYISDKKSRIKTKKVETFQTVAEATDKHPAQVEKVFNDVIAGRWETILLSGKIRPSTKSQMLKKVDNLSGVFQNAREAANNATVKDLKMGKMICDYVMEPLKEELK